ncbi:amino acid ABC transporter substrate-binding protein [Liberibacter crescens]|nr:amino acid ABC transporter substrate-binding protein [Liberibacter crescens]
MIISGVYFLALCKFITVPSYGEENIRPKESTVLKIGLEGTYPPYSFHDINGTLTGFEVAIATEVAKRIGVKAQFIEGKWDGLIAGIDTGRYDIIVNMVNITPEREKKYTFSSPYIKSKAVLIVRKDNTSIKSFNDLKGKKSAQTITSNFSGLAKNAGADLVLSDGFEQSIQLILTGRADATINENLSFLDFKKHKPDAPLKVVDQEKDVVSCGILMAKGKNTLKAQIDKALSEIKNDGTYKSISIKYFDVDVSQ